MELNLFTNYKPPFSLYEKCCGHLKQATRKFPNELKETDKKVLEEIQKIINELAVNGSDIDAMYDNPNTLAPETSIYKVGMKLVVIDGVPTEVPIIKPIIVMPMESFFDSPEGYLLSLKHELVHAKKIAEDLKNGISFKPSEDSVQRIKDYLIEERRAHQETLDFFDEKGIPYDKNNEQVYINSVDNHLKKIKEFEQTGIDENLWNDSINLGLKINPTGSPYWQAINGSLLYAELMENKKNNPNKSTDDILSELEGKYKPQEPSVDPSECHCPETCRCVGNCEEMQGPPPFWDKKPDINDLWDNAKRTSSPLVLDLNGNGISTTSLDNGVYFDHDGNGFAGKSGWLSKGEGILALDRNDNGVIDDGGELFGNNTLLANGKYAINGFEALKVFDINRDGVIDEKDAIYKDLKVWVDNNGDAFSDKDELLTLEEAGVKSINLGYINSNYVDEHGNAHKQQGSFTKADGTTAVINDVWFKVDYVDAIDIIDIEISAEVKALIYDIKGMGNVHNLHTAIMLDESGRMKALLTNILEQLKESVDSDQLSDQVNQLMFLWAGTDHYAVNARGSNIDARIVYAIEAFKGEKYLEHGVHTLISAKPVPALLEIYDLLKDHLFDRLIYTVRLEPLINNTASYNSETKQYIFDINKLALGFQSELNKSMADSYKLFTIFREIAQTEGTFETGIIDQLIGQANILDPHFGKIIALFNNPDYSVTTVPNAQGKIMNANYNDRGLLIGGSGNDIIDGDFYDDFLIGGKGDDLLIGGHGNDTYIVSRGDGNDTINNNYHGAWNYTEIDRIVFTDIAFAEASFRGEDYDLIIDYGENDSIRILNFFKGQHDWISEFEFTDKTLTLADLQQMVIRIVASGNLSFGWDGVLEVHGSDQSSEIICGGKGTIIYSGSGDDTIWNTHGNAQLYGGAGNDTLRGNYGSQLYGGTGNDTLHGSYGSQLYGGAGNDTLHGSYGSQLYGGDGDDYLEGNNILLDGGEGDDILQGGGTFIGGKGNDTLYAIKTGSSDTFYFNLGDGQDIIYLEDKSSNMRGKDKIIFGANVTPDMISYRQIGDDFIMVIGDQGDQMTFKDYYKGGNYQVIDSIEFEDGTVWMYWEMFNNGYFRYEGTESDDVINGSDKNDRIIAGLGNDTIYGGRGNDYLDGGAGNDTIHSGGTSGNGGNTIIGGLGNDIIHIDSLSNKILFNLGDEKDTIYIHSRTSKNKNVIVFGEGITEEMILFYIKGSDLIMVVGDQGDEITIVDYIKDDDAGSYMFTLEFADGTVWASNDITQRPLIQDYTNKVVHTEIQGTRYNDIIYGTSGNDIITDLYTDIFRKNYIDGGDGDDIITAQGIIKGGKGNDTIKAKMHYFGDLNNTILFDLGDGQDILEGNDGFCVKYYYKNMDHIIFGIGITPDMVTFEKGKLGYTLKIGTQGDQIFVDYKHYLGAIKFADGTLWDWDYIKEKTITYRFTDQNDVIDGSQLLYDGYNSVIYAGDGNDVINLPYGGGFFGYIDGGAGNDIINGTGKIRGNTGDDSITVSRWGYDMSLLFDLGDGKDTIYGYKYDNSYEAYRYGTKDKLILGSGITSDMLTYTRDRLDLVITVGDGGDQMTFKGYFKGELYQHINRIEFADGTILTDMRTQTVLADLIGSGNNAIVGTDGNNILTGTNADDDIYGEGGNDTITDNAGNNYLDGGAGDDRITGRGTFIGGIGNDALTANVVGSADTFIFNIGDGKDIITSTDSAKTTDTLKFGEGITKEMISYRKSGYHLIVVVGDKGDQITLTNYFLNLNNQTVNRFEFSDGSAWDDIRQTQLTQYYTNSAETITGTPWDDVIYGLGGNDTITDSIGNNIMDGGAGDDKITGKGTFIGGIGNDTLTANVVGSADTFVFNLGDGKDTITSTDSAKTTDTLKFGEGITKEMITYRKSGYHLIVMVGDKGDQITLTNYFYNLNNQTVNRFEFSDGSAWDDIRQTQLTQYYTNNAETITGTPWDDVIYGEGGNDTITDNVGDNYLDGGAGNDRITGTGTLIGGAGADTLAGSGIFIGGIGNDIINAKTNGSADTFIFNLGDGQDTINCLDTQKLTDMLKFGEGITSDMVTHSQVGNNLILTIRSTGDKITVVSYFSGGNYRTLNLIEFADGTKWAANNQKGAAFGYQVTPPPANTPYAAPVAASRMLMSNQANSNLDTLTQEQQGLINPLESKEIIPETTVQQKIKSIPNKVLLDTVNNSMMDAPTEMLQAFIARSALKMQTAMDKKALASDTPSDHSPIMKLREKMIPIPPERYLSTSMEQNPLTALYEADTYGANTGRKGMNADDARALQSMISAMAAFGTGASSSNDLIDSDYSMAPRIFAPTN